MRNEKENWSVRLVRSDGAVEEFFGGKVPGPYVPGVVAVYKTPEETQRYRDDSVDSYGKVLVPPLYDEPIAWLIQQPDDGCDPYVTVSRGGPIRKPGEDDVMAVFETQAEAEAYIAADRKRKEEFLAAKPDWRTLPDNCAYCGHPRIWHAGNCIWEDDIDSNGHWTMCLKDCPQYVAPQDRC